MRIGVLALQGAFSEHIAHINKLDVEGFEIRQKKDLHRELDGLIIPGGESMVIGKLLNELGLLESVRQMIAEGLPVLGTCAGLILLAQKVENDTEPHLLKAMDITASRNAYGRQLGSFQTRAEFNGKDIPLVFIRAPFISQYGPSVRPLATIDKKIVAAQQGSMLATAFHPELTSDTTVHEHFLACIESR